MKPSLFSQLPQYWMQGMIENLNGFRRGWSEPFPVHEDPPPTTPYTVISERGKVQLRYYQAVGQPQATPLLLVYALIKRPFILDLLPGRSVVENLTKQGFSVYLVDWIPPTSADRWRGFEAYVNDNLADAVRMVQHHAGVRRISLFGYCFEGEEFMAEHERPQSHEQYSFVMRLFSDLTDSWYGTARRAASYYVDIGEEFAKGAVELQKETTDFLKDATPLLEEQNNVTREFVERSAEVARKLLQMQMEKGEEAVHKATDRSEEMRFAGHS